MATVIDQYRNRYTIRNYDMGNNMKLQKALSVWDKQYFRISNAYYIYDDEMRELHLPSTISKSRIVNWYSGKDIQFIDRTNEVVSHKDAPFHIEMIDGFQLKDDQIAPVDFLLGVGEYHQYHNVSDKQLALRTGGGKTICGIYTAVELQKRAMFITPTSTLFNIWLEKIDAFTKNGTKRTYKIKGSASVLKLIKNPKLAEKYDFYVASTDTLSALHKTGGMGILRKLFEILQIGIKVIDESHTKSNAMLKCHVSAPTLYTFFLTATPKKSSHLDKIAFKNAMSGVHTVGLLSRKYSKHIHYRYLEYDSYPLDHQLAQCRTSKGFSSSLYEAYILNSPYRDGWITMIVKEILMLNDLYDPEDRIVVMFERLATIQLFYDILIHELPEVAIGLYCGLVKSKDKDAEKMKRIVLSTPPSFGTGTDLDMLRGELYVPSYSSEVTAEQAPNRLRDIVLEKEDDNGNTIKYRKSVHYYEFIDFGFPDMVRQYKTRKKVHQLTAASMRNKKVNIVTILEETFGESATTEEK